MFPSNLHKNIIQLDRQISLLESECKNMDIDKRKRSISAKQSRSKCSKISDVQLKSPPVKDNCKKPGFCYGSLKTNTKLTPPVSPRVCSTSSLPSNFSKTRSRITEGCNVKKHGANTNHPCQMNDKLFHSNKSDNVCSKYVYCNEKVPPSPHKKDIKIHCISDDDKNVDVLHKEVLFSNPGGMIEVTVTRKSTAGNQNDNLPFKKVISISKDGFEQDGDSCKCHDKGKSKGQKWCEILGLDFAKRKEANCDTCSVNQEVTDENESYYYPSLHSAPVKAFDQGVLMEHQNNQKVVKRKEVMTPPEKLVHQSPERRKTAQEVFKSKREKGTQCCLSNDESKIFQLLMDRLKPSEQEIKKVLNKMEEASTEPSHNQANDGFGKCLEGSKSEFFEISSQEDLFQFVKRISEYLRKDKDLLSQELAAKDKMIGTLKKREEDYLSLISSLKANLEKTKENAQDGLSTLKELNIVKKKLLEQIKVSEALKKSHSNMQKILEKFALENDKLKTQIQIFKLESQKHDVLLAGKEAEVKRYKEEIENFQRQISEHLASLKSNAQAIDVEKMMEAIIQQSQLFIQTDSESILCEKEKDSSKHNGLMHSSPTSTKTSVVNSSWKQISSIRETDHMKLNVDKFETDENEEKEFLQVYGENLSSESEESIAGKTKKERRTSFTSCLSMRDDFDGSSVPKDEAVSKEEYTTSEPDGSKQMSSEKLRTSIEELLQKMKLKWSKEIYGASPDNLTIDDFLNGSQISSI